MYSPPGKGGEGEEREGGTYIIGQGGGQGGEDKDEENDEVEEDKEAREER